MSSGGLTAIVIVLIVMAGIAGPTIAYFRLQQHRADAVAMAGYRKLAEQAVENEKALHAQLEELTTRLAAVESLLRSVG